MDIKCLQSIKDELKDYHKNKSDLVLYYISERLNQSFNTYVGELKDSLNFIETKNDLEVLRNLKG